MLVQPEVKLELRHEVKTAAIIGCGSIGRRHIENLITLGVTNIVALRVQKKSTEGFLKEFAVREVFTWEDLLSCQPDIAIIANPSSLHLDTFSNLVGHVRGIFIEKPISHNMNDIDEAIKGILEYKTTTFVGYNLRFHPIVKKITEVIESRELGALISFQANVGQWLPDWHINEDHEKSYVANKNLGGGALLSLIHEVQMALDWCGGYKHVYALFPKSQLLDLDVDVKADLMIEHLSGATSQIHIDLIQKPMARSGVLTFQRGSIHYDFVRKKVELRDCETPNGKIVWDEPNYDNNLPYIEMMKEFISYVREGRRGHPYDLLSGLDSLRLACEAFNQHGVLAVQESYG